MGKRMIERRLRQTSARLRVLREELGVIDEQLAQLADEASDSAIRALVSESPGVSYEHRKAQEHADAMAAHRDHVVTTITSLELRQDQLLDELAALAHP
jgi:hypothetical protein